MNALPGKLLLVDLVALLPLPVLPLIVLRGRPPDSKPPICILRLTALVPCLCSSPLASSILPLPPACFLTTNHRP